MKKIITLLFIATTWLYASADNNDSNTTKNKSNDSKLWQSSLFVGVQVLPDYDANNTNKGFGKSRLYANLNLDARWKYLDDHNESKGIMNLGLDVKLLGTPVSRSESNTTNLSQVTFDDVADTIDASVYVGYVPGCLHFGKVEKKFSSELGLDFRAGVISREKKSADQSIVDYYAGGGVKYTFFRANPYKGTTAETLPDGYFTYNFRYYSEYAQKKDVYRHVFEFRYKISQDHNWYIGSHADLGGSNEQIYLTLSIKYDDDQIFELLGFEANQGKK